MVYNINDIPINNNSVFKIIEYYANRDTYLGYYEYKQYIVALKVYYNSL